MTLYRTEFHDIPTPEGQWRTLFRLRPGALALARKVAGPHATEGDRALLAAVAHDAGLLHLWVVLRHWTSTRDPGRGRRG